MNSKFKFTIPEPCNENWDKMTPDETGRFCLVCNKSVIDFTNKLPEEIQHFFLKNQNQKICGRFRSSHLDSINVKISSIFYPQSNYHKTFLLTVFLIIGTNLHSQTSMEATDPKSSLQVEAIKDMQSKDSNTLFEDIDDDSSIMGPIEFTHDSFLLLKSKNRKILFSTYPEYYEEKRDTEKKEIETRPYYPEGIRAFYAFFASEFKIAENIPFEDIFISFTIERNGSLTYIQPYIYIDKSIQKEIIRVLRRSPKWIPGKSKGINISKKYSFGISIYNGSITD